MDKTVIAALTELRLTRKLEALVGNTITQTEFLFLNADDTITFCYHVRVPETIPLKIKIGDAWYAPEIDLQNLTYDRLCIFIFPAEELYRWANLLP